MNRALMHRLLFWPSRDLVEPPPDRLSVEAVTIETQDSQRLHAWWVRAEGPAVGHVLFCHGNAGNIGSRTGYARMLAGAGLDVLLFDYRGYGASTGRPTERGTYLDARAALQTLLGRDGVDRERLLYLGESLGGAVALELARHRPPAGLILQSAFTSVREMARAVYPFVPRVLVPDAYPSLRLIRELSNPLLVIHGEGDDIVPLSQGRALYQAAPVPKRLEVLQGVRHNDLLLLACDRWLEAIRSWIAEVVGLV